MPFGFFVEVDPGARPGHELPGGPPSAVDPGWGNRPPSGGTLPEPPPGVWPPPSMGTPIVPIGPDNTLPVQPGTIWPSPGRPARPDQGLPGGGHVSGQPIPGQPARPDQGLPGAPAMPGHDLPSKTYWVLCWNSVTGWAYHAVDPSLRPGHALPGGGHVSGQPVPTPPAHPDQGLPPTPQPRR